MGRNKNKNKEQRLKKRNAKLLTALMPTSTTASTATSTQASATTLTTSGDANDDGMTATTTLVCHHGSAEKHFVMGSEYQLVVDAWVSVLQKGTTSEFLNLYNNFSTKYGNLLKDSDFFRYIFASTTNMFRKCYKTEKYSSSKRNLQRMLYLGIDSKYGHYPLFADTEKLDKYRRDIETVRGIINCLYRETHTFCHCMKPYKIEAIGMRKLGLCRGCEQEFPKGALKLCSGCDSVQYCSNTCMKTNWPIHKKFCNNYNNIKSVEKDDVSTADLCSGKERKDDLLSNIVGEDGYKIDESPGEGFGMQQKLVLAGVFDYNHHYAGLPDAEL